MKSFEVKSSTQECTYALLVALKQEVLSIEEPLEFYLLQLGIVPILVNVIKSGVEDISYEAAWILINLSASNSRAVSVIRSLRAHYELLELSKHCTDKLKELVIHVFSVVFVDNRKCCGGR